MSKKLHVPLHDSGNPIDLTGNTSPTNNGATDSVYGIGGLTAYSFDGTDDWINPSSSIVSSFPCTLSAWFRAVDASVFDSTFAGIVTLRDQSSGLALITLNMLDDGKINATSRGVGGTQKSTSTNNSYDDGEWHLATATFSRENDRQILYVDGLSRTQSQVTPDTDFSSLDRPAIGADNNLENTGDYFSGSIADVRVYDRVLSPSEIQTLYQFGANDYTRQSLHDGSDSGAVSRWKFDSNGDSDSNWPTSNDGTNDAGVTYGDSDAVYGSSAVFESANNDSIELNSSSVDYDTNHTISAWVNTSTQSQQIIVSERDANFKGVSLQIKDVGTNGIYNAQYVVNDGSSGAGSTGTTGLLNGWQHIVGIYRDGNAEVYVNGAKEGEADASSLGSIEVNDSLAIGTDSGGTTDGVGGNFYFDGKIDDVRIYDRALSQAEVAQLYREKHGADMRSRTVIQ